ncbi:hypothetical protein CDL12_16358 [Handroanthus impetiginosus]|uniref:Uncharacterized protein n=1 Tax=Handroanthus impetiginosus TaxID=429701 RepID=A0A2G9H0J9_9LAMI|nr:hypothetical protein CDL12_16358 [Handroanthus impetiginosus]
MGFDEVMKSLGGKLMEALLPVGNWGAEALGWFDGVLPPDTRGGKIKNCFHVVQLYLIGMRRGEMIKHWFHVAQPYVNAAQPYLIAAVILTMLVYFCGGGGGGGGSVKMMKAPGRNYRMPRHDFEIDPQGYFQNLRSHP